MAITFVAASAAGTPSSLSTLSVSKPAGTSENDVLVAYGAITAGKNISSTGWTSLGTFDTGGGSASCFYFYKVAGASEPTNYDFTLNPSTDNCAITMMCFRGVDTASPVRTSGTSTGTGTTSDTSPALTGVQATDMVAIMAGGRPSSSGGATYTTPETGGWISPAGADALSTGSFAAGVDGSYKLGDGSAQSVKASKGSWYGIVAIALAQGASAAQDYVKDVSDAESLDDNATQNKQQGMAPEITSFVWDYTLTLGGV